MRDPLSALRDARLARWLARSQRGDRDAFRALYRTLHGPVSRFVRRRVSATADADDVVAQVFFQFLDRLQGIDPARGTVTAYALSIARNLLADRARAAARTASEPDLPDLADPAPGAAEALEWAEEVAWLRRALASLEPHVREAVELRYGDELSFAEIAQLLKTSEAAVRQRVSRAIRGLRARSAEWLRQRGGLANET